MNNLLYLIIGSFVIILLFGFLYIFLKKRKDEEIQITDRNLSYEVLGVEQEKYIMPTHKKITIILLIVLLISGLFAVIFIKKQNNKPEVLPDGTVVYDFSKQSQPKASKILYEYVLEELTHYYGTEDEQIDFIKNKHKAKEIYNLTKNSIAAFEYDLNDDGENEIIGFPFAGFFYCAQGYSFYILQKKDNKYYNILDEKYMFHVEPILNLYILKNKTNGYNDIIYHGSYLYNFPLKIIKYDKKGYVLK